MLGGAATREHPGPGEDPGAAPGITPGCQVLGIGVDTPAAHGQGELGHGIGTLG